MKSEKGLQKLVGRKETISPDVEGKPIWFGYINRTEEENVCVFYTTFSLFMENYYVDI